MKRFLFFAISALAIFAAASAWLALYPGVPRDLGGAVDLDRTARRVSIPVGDDTIDGWVFGGTRREVVLLFHGYGRDHTRAWRYAAFLLRAGYGVVTVDFRSSRVHDRKPTTLGHYESIDAEATLEWVERDPALRRDRIGVLGESLGGSVALWLAARHPEIAAVVADCPFATGARAIEDATERWAHVPRWPAAALARAGGRVLTGYDPGALDAIAAAESLRSRPLLFIHALRDDRFAPEQARDLWRAAGAKDEIWLLPEGHNQAWRLHGAEYERRVLAFFGRYLGEGTLANLGEGARSGAAVSAHAVASLARGAAHRVAGAAHRGSRKP
jgi:dipeptidyl aminopeptidase/acylaminoacyl peptidase